MNTPGSVFLTMLRCQLWQPEQGRVIAEEFRLPKLPVREAVGVLESLGVDIFAGQ